MIKAFYDWLESLNLKPEECVSLDMAYNAGRAYQREVDAKIAESAYGYGSEDAGYEIAQQIREQKIDD